MLVIHPKDETTTFLERIYKDKQYDLLTEKNSNASINESLNKSNQIMILGHGTQDGLLSRMKEGGDFDRFIVNSNHVDFLRNKECVGIWCNANLFAERYNLKGLFSGMIISELEEAYMFDIDASKEEIEKENIAFAENIKYCLDNFELKDIPAKMLELNTNPTPLTNFNYNNIFYF